MTDSGDGGESGGDELPCATEGKGGKSACVDRGQFPLTYLCENLTSSTKSEVLCFLSYTSGQ